MRKSIDGVAAIFGALKARAAYVPVDPQAPAARNAFILNDCSRRALVMERRFEARWREALQPLRLARTRVVSRVRYPRLIASYRWGAWPISGQRRRLAIGQASAPDGAQATRILSLLPCVCLALKRG
jgi:acyl-CoA synthetase (AMP-forming)/AMP-acid ligase II